MARSLSDLGQDPAFELFLGALVGTDVPGANVSVMSMLSRLGLDPWDEATDLARMPKAPAQQRLNSLMEQFSDVPSLAAGYGEVTGRLVALLPVKPAPRITLGTQSYGPRLALPQMGLGAYSLGALAVLLVYIGYLASGN
ncbi:MAG: hypothetical protein K9G71_09935 [Rhodobacteraceae bacterium]|nr:hypothetical protein [Paracoccaceae bacterium]MCF8514544.1 hypothetical protein [Paracoccaceae bacterium]MCF8518916.1 hypothetical protein [Paracoccaceae bacterium]